VTKIPLASVNTIAAGRGNWRRARKAATNGPVITTRTPHSIIRGRQPSSVTTHAAIAKNYVQAGTAASAHRARTPVGVVGFVVIGLSSLVSATRKSDTSLVRAAASHRFGQASRTGREPVPAASGPQSRDRRLSKRDRRVGLLRAPPRRPVARVVENGEPT
jgi:hypothetical protein